MGMLESPQTYYYGSLLDVESVSPRIMLAAFNGIPRTIISCCSTTNCSDKTSSSNIACYKMLYDNCRSIIVIIAEDMNAQDRRIQLVSVFLIKRIEMAICFWIWQRRVNWWVWVQRSRRRKVIFGYIHVPTEKEHNSTISSSTRCGETVQWTASLTTRCALYSLIIGRVLPKIRLSPITCQR